MELASFLLLTSMRQKHILLAGEIKTNSLPISLMLESYNFNISVFSKEVNFLEKIKYFKSKNDPVDLIILGTGLSDLQINSFFDNINVILPFIIISDSKKINLISYILNKGFYGYLVKPSDHVLLIEHVNTIFFNINKYKENS